MLNLRPPSNRGLVTPPPRLPTPPPIIEGQYEVQSILTSRIVRHLRSGIEIRQFLIKWKNYSYQELTWEDENNLIDLCGAERKRRRKAKLLGLSTSNENSG
uniref:Chromo domain-containing protein n=1 Tax=Meloidogyne hapla TaxID=6305 RepID=A0A1I8BWF5_MELHA